MPAQMSASEAEPSWSQADLERAIAVAERAGLGAYRIEIAPNGTISIVVGTPETPDSAKA